ncbi:MAG: lytic transglycosylase domain-containing protein [Thermoanaerobaculia bacterium]
MLKLYRVRWPLVATILAVAITGVVLLTLFHERPISDERRKELAQLQNPEAPPDLAKLQVKFEEGLTALQGNEGATAVEKLSSFGFGSRRVEEYRLYYLANAYQLDGNPAAARLTLARLWRRTPRLIYGTDAAFNLAGLYATSGDWRRAADVYASIALRTSDQAIAANARWLAVGARLNDGDFTGALDAARRIVIYHPASAQAGEALALLQSINGSAPEDLGLAPQDRLARAEALLAAQKPESALSELDALASSAPGSLGPSIRLQRGIAMSRLRRFEESNEVLEPLTGGALKQAIPALHQAARNYAVVSASIDPKVIKTVKEKKRQGSVKVRVGKGKKSRLVTRPRYVTVTRKIELVDLAKKEKKERYERLASERLKDLLLLPISPDLKHSVLSSLIDRALAKNQDAYAQELVPQLIALDPLADPALQHFWNKAWTAYVKRDLAGARDLFDFVRSTYTHPNIRRQADYWYARTTERLGKGDEAKEIYQRLASAPYADVYARFSADRGARRRQPKSDPLELARPDWQEIAEKQMPDELRLAYELTAMSQMRDAYAELRANMTRENTRFAEALLAEYHQSAGNTVLMYRSLRRAWPQLATPEQDTVPLHFMQMYYPLRYTGEIREYAKKNGLDPHLVQGLIHQESYYNPKARSRVGATGLMQLMPPTAAEHARRLRIPFGASRLENPEVNIQLGTFHLAMLIRMFSGNVHMAVASYNAGQGNVAKWKRASPGMPLDEFVESIPFMETRTYVKRVTMLRASYERLDP